MICKYLWLLVLYAHVLCEHKKHDRSDRGGDKIIIVPKVKINNHQTIKYNEGENHNKFRVKQYKSIFINKREADNFSIEKKGTTHKLCTESSDIKGTTAITNNKIGILLKKLSNKASITHSQNTCTKPATICLQHLNRSSPQQSAVLNQILHKITKNKSNVTTSTSPNVCVTLKYFKIKPLRHKGGDPGNHYYHGKHVAHGNKTRFNINMATHIPYLDITKNDTAMETFKQATTTVEIGKAVGERRKSTCAPNDIKYILPDRRY